MNPNGRPIIPHGGVLLEKIPDAIPWDAFVACGLRVMHEGNPVVVMLAPEPTTDVDEAISLFRLLLASHSPKPGPLEWNSVPEGVRRHFRFVEQPA